MTRLIVLSVSVLSAVILLVACAMASSTTAESPFAGTRLWVDPDSQAARDAARLRSRPRDYRLLWSIARRPQAVWLSGSPRTVRAAAGRVTSSAARDGALPVFVAYNVPLRDCRGHAAGGAPTARAYLRWIRALAAGLGGRRSVGVLEPDALAGLDCLAAARRRERVALMARAVRLLEAQPRVAVYLDAGHSGWQPPAVMARRLLAAGLRRARGFALNVSNFRRTRTEVAYGMRIAESTGGKPFVVDTSRNGRGPAPQDAWCNPPGRALGTPPRTRDLPSRLVDALLWIKRPGESDGECHGGPPAGAWWRDYALELARSARSAR
jgi:endoglucanase